MTHKTDFSVIGQDRPVADVEAKLRGQCEYLGDISFPDMLHCKILRSPHGHARIKRIDVSRAKALRGVVDVITHEDVADRRVQRVNAPHPSIPYPTDACILEQEARYVGDRIAAVAAVSPEIATRALGLIEVDYELLPTVVDPVEAIAPGAPIVNQFRWMGEQKLPNTNNCNDPEMPEGFPSLIDAHWGDVEAGFESADVIVEGEYRTGYQHPAPLARPICLCRPRAGGRLEVWSSTQGIHPLRHCLAESLGMPLSKIKVYRQPIGGAFGLYIYMQLHDAICAFMATRTGRPVRLELSREEMAYDGGRHEMVIRLRTGAKADGTLVAMDMSVVDGSGAYQPSPDINALAMGFFLSKYRCPNKRYEGHSVYTNTPPRGSMRGAGNPQIHFAMESQMDELAEKMSMDPIALRMKNHPTIGDIFVGQSIEVQSPIASCQMEQVIEEGCARIGWDGGRVEAPYPDKPWIKSAKGMACAVHTSGAGSKDNSIIVMDYSGAIVKMNEDGTANLIIAAADYGTANSASIAAIVAEELGLCHEEVLVTETDTDSSRYEFVVHASRSIYSVGVAAKMAAQHVKREMLTLAGELMQLPADELDSGLSIVYWREDQDRAVSIREVMQYAQSRNLGAPIGTASHRSSACPPHFVATFVEVEVDTLTGEVKVTKAVQGADVGVPINPQAVRGQLIGGFHQGLGYALTEHQVCDPVSGEILNPSFKDYKLLTPLDMPEVDAFTVDSVEPTGPFGAKGIGEGCINGVAPAIYNAVANATGVRIFDMPLTPEKLLKGLAYGQKDKVTATGSVNAFIAS